MVFAFILSEWVFSIGLRFAFGYFQEHCHIDNAVPEFMSERVLSVVFGITTRLLLKACIDFDALSDNTANNTSSSCEYSSQSEISPDSSSLTSIGTRKPLASS